MLVDNVLKAAHILFFTLTVQCYHTLYSYNHTVYVWCVSWHTVKIDVMCCLTSRMMIHVWMRILWQHGTPWYTQQVELWYAPREQLMTQSLTLAHWSLWESLMMWRRWIQWRVSVCTCVYVVSVSVWVCVCVCVCVCVYESVCVSVCGSLTVFQTYSLCGFHWKRFILLFWHHSLTTAAFTTLSAEFSMDRLNNRDSDGFFSRRIVIRCSDSPYSSNLQMG